MLVCVDPCLIGPVIPINEKLEIFACMCSKESMR